MFILLYILARAKSWLDVFDRKSHGNFTLLYIYIYDYVLLLYIQRGKEA